MRVVYGKNKTTGRANNKTTSKAVNSQLVRLLVCFALFLAVYIGKGVSPDRLAGTGPKLLRVIRDNIDFEQELYTLGRTLAQEDSVLGGIGELCVEVFGPQQGVETLPGASETVDRFGDLGLGFGNAAGALAENIRIIKQEAQAEPVFRPGDVIEDLPAEGQPLPAGYDHRLICLGNEETVTPVLGRITSEFGYRDHPTKGRHAVHNGVDIGADAGQDVVSFMNGVVEEVGENSDFGKYLFIAHPNGVRTFYAHCSSICVGQGQRVKAGETVARVGSTGQSTGPHLHFELEMNGTRLDPLHYIEHTGA